MSTNNPYRHELTEACAPIKQRVNTIIFNFIGNKTWGLCLDIGERNPQTESLEKQLDIQIESTDIDLDIGTLSGSYDTVFCFEVIEHLFNPLHLLQQIHHVMKKDGILFLSTPKGKPHFLVAAHHFHEMYERDLRALIKRAGFDIVRLEYHRVRPLSHCIGFRPLLRFFLERKTMLELKKQS